MIATIKVGLAGWSYKDWEGIVYPASVKGTHRLEYLAEFFDLIEINTTFYGHIKPAVGKQWCTMASGNPNFVFTAKLNRAFTHSPVADIESTSAETIRPGPTDEGDVKQGLDSLAQEGKLGALLAQFPISFKCTDKNRAYVEQLVARFRDYPLAIEIRHATWNEPRILEWLSEMNVSLCNIDQPLIGRAVRPSSHSTSGIGYVRLHGRNYKQWFTETKAWDRYDYLYTPQELEKWKDRIVDVAEKTQTTYVVANNHNFGKAAVNALQLIAMLEARRVRAPEPLVLRYPELREVSLDT